MFCLLLRGALGAAPETAPTGWKIRRFFRHRENAIWDATRQIFHEADGFERQIHGSKDDRELGARPGHLVKERPDFIITTGTMVAYPFYLLAVLFHKKFIFIETFGRANMPTEAGKKMEKHSDLFIVQWESQKKFYTKAIYGGCLYWWSSLR